MNNNCRVRVACNLDSDNIFQIDQEYDHENYTLDMINTSLKNENYYNIILSIDDKDIGYISASIVCDECELIKIVVKKEYRSQGFGKILIENLKEYCIKNNIAKIFLEVREDNLIAKNSYLHSGFEKVGVRKGYYNGIDAEIYWCKINGEKN